MNAHLENYFDLQIEAAVDALGKEFAAPVGVYVGGGLVFDWDNQRNLCETQS